MRGRGMHGVTLIELMIVVVIVGILAAIAYPSYRSQVRKTHRAEGKAALLDAGQQLERCYARYNSYAAGGCSTLTTALATGYLSEQGWYEIKDTNPGAATFTLVATPQGAQADDTECGSLSLTQTGQRSATGTAAATCW